MKAQRETERFAIFEWPQPLCEIKSKSTEMWICVSQPEDAVMIRDSLNEFLKCIPREFGGEKE